MRASGAPSGAVVARVIALDICVSAEIASLNHAMNCSIGSASTSRSSSERCVYSVRSRERSSDFLAAVALIFFGWLTHDWPGGWTLERQRSSKISGVIKRRRGILAGAGDAGGWQGAPDRRVGSQKIRLARMVFRLARRRIARNKFASVKLDLHARCDDR